MPVPIGSTLGIFADNVVKRKSVLPLSNKKVTRWASGLNIPHGGPTVLYTGQMYQLIPSINSMAKVLSKMENSWVTKYFGIGRELNKLLNLTTLMAHPDPKEQQAYEKPLRNIAKLLKTAGVQFGYLYDDDFYVGALAYDEGLDDAFEAHAAFIYEKLKVNGVKDVITVDPHTTNMLRTVYPKVIPEFNIKVKSYLEVLAELMAEAQKPIDIDITIQDSCIYARAENVIDQPRLLLKLTGANVKEHDLSGKATHCCGGPLESLFPGKAEEIAKERIQQLATCSKRVATLCPICLASLKRASPADMAVQDISNYLVKAFCRTDAS